MSGSSVVEPGDEGARAETVLRVVSGSPTPEELAVVTALVAAAGSGGGAAPEPPKRGRWADPKWNLRGAWLTGPGAWHNSLR